MDLGKLKELSHRRKCVTCGAVFESDPDSMKDGLSSMQKHVDHMTEHNPTPEQWNEAYHRIQASKPRSG